MLQGNPQDHQSCVSNTPVVMETGILLLELLHFFPFFCFPKLFSCEGMSCGGLFGQERSSSRWDELLWSKGGAAVTPELPAPGFEMIWQSCVGSLTQNGWRGTKIWEAEPLEHLSHHLGGHREAARSALIPPKFSAQHKAPPRAEKSE